MLPLQNQKKMQHEIATCKSTQKLIKINWRIPYDLQKQ